MLEVSHVAELSMSLECSICLLTLPRYSDRSFENVYALSKNAGAANEYAVRQAMKTNDERIPDALASQRPR